MYMQSPYGRRGGKKQLAKQIVSELPKNYENMIYVEPFFGAGSVYFRKNKSIEEVINDKDKDVIYIINMFKKYPGKTISNAINGNYTQNDFTEVMDSKPSTQLGKGLKYLFLGKNSFLGNMRTFNELGSKISTHYDNKYKERLKDTKILNTDYKKVINEYDGVNTLIYLDPPYENSKDYKYSIEPEEIFEVVSNIKGKFLLSYNYSENIKNIFRKFKMKKVKVLYSNSIGGALKKEELLIMNY